MTYETAVNKNLNRKKCVIGLYRNSSPRVGAGNDPTAPIYAGYVLRASLAASKIALSKHQTLTDDISYPLPDGRRDFDRWADIRRNPTLIRRAVTSLSNRARKLGFESVEVWDYSRQKPVLQSSRKLAPDSAA